MSDKSWLGGMIVVVLQFPCRVNACVFRNLNGVISRSAWEYIDTKKSTPNSKDRQIALCQPSKNGYDCLTCKLM